MSIVLNENNVEIVDGVYRDGEVVLTPIFSDKYKFSNYLVNTVEGKVYSKRKGDYLQSSPNDNGYCYVSITADCGYKRAYGVHVLVMASYMGMSLEMFKRGQWEVDHIKNDEKDNNKIVNLRLATRFSQYDNFEIRKKMGKGKRLNKEQVVEIKQRLAEWIEDEDNKISEFIHKIAKEYGQTYRNVWNIVYDKTWKDVEFK